MEKTLYQVEMRVHFTKDHPKVNEFAFGILQVWIFSKSPNAAGETALKIARFLPYKIFGVKAFPYDESKHPGSVLAVEVNASVSGTGIAINLIHYPKGTDEFATLGYWPCLVPHLDIND